MQLDDLRREYRYKGLTRDELHADPFQQFTAWMQQAVDAEVVDATAMSLATVSKEGQPSQRTVLLKHVDQAGFVFYTNLGSEKARNISDNNKVSLLFAWLPLSRQVKIRGLATRLSTAEVLKYFASRPFNSQIAAWASHQSQTIGSRAILEQAYDSMRKKFTEGKVPLPDFWGGYRVKPFAIEFWQGRENRLHDRFLYEQITEKQWQITRLAP